MPVKQSERSSRQSLVKSFPVIALGGSAGSFASFEKFFMNMSADTGMAFIVIMHLDRQQSISIVDIFRGYTPMTVIEAEDGMPVQPDKVYVIPPNKDMGIHNRKLLLLPPARPNGYQLAIDYFFQSLAEDLWNKAVVVVFSGMGSDGETGVRIIKEKLGMAMVQDPATAQYDSMPLAAIGTNMVDYVLAPEEMPVKLIQYLNHPAFSEEPTERMRTEIKDSTAVQKILMLLRSNTGHDFSLYKKNTITRRIDRRIAFHQLPDYESYIHYLRENPHETEVLFSELLIGVTKFFRDKGAFDILKVRLAKVLSEKSAEEPIRVWVAGCSTGEEAYSIAILLMEHLETLKVTRVPKVQVFATDLDVEAIEHARAGLYHDNIIADVSIERLEKYFIKSDNFYSVKKELREMIIFAQHNLIKDAPFTRLDLLCCRNLMIYLTGELQKKIIPVFHYSLAPKSILFLGPAETIGGFNDLFASLDHKWKLFERINGASNGGKLIDFPFNIGKQPALSPRLDDPMKLSKKRSMSDSFNRVLLENHTPASILVNEKGDILYVSGKTGHFLELTSGDAEMNIFELAREELKYAIGNAMHQARFRKEMVLLNDIKLREGKQVRLIDLKVSLLHQGELLGLFVVIFDDKGLKKTPGKKLSAAAKSVATEELEKELLYTKQQLHSTIEQMETSLEELKSTNEELQSTNEELQSTNEESLTTKEEMQSLNEELMTINIQYQSKAEELTELNNDMKNLLDNTEIGTIFLDNHLDILRFTPQVKKLFNIIPTDIGRPITHIVSNFDYPDIEADIRQVIESLAVREIEVRTKLGEWYNLRIMPYRTMDNFISGAVLTFNKITTLKELQDELTRLNRYTEVLVNSLHRPAVLLNKDLEVIAASDEFYSLFELSTKELPGKKLKDFIKVFWKTARLDQLLKPDGVKSGEVVGEYSFPEGPRKLKINIEPTNDASSKALATILITITPQS